jgi:hypothetical protein
MPALRIAYRGEGERLALGQATACVADLRRLALDAPAGAVLDACERLALGRGRSLLRATLAASLPARATAAAEQKGGTPGSAPRHTPDARRAATSDPSRPPSASPPRDAALSPAPAAVKAASPPAASWASTAT